MRAEKAQKHHFFSSLKTLKKHEFDFLQITKVEKTSFQFFVSSKNLKKDDLIFSSIFKKIQEI